MIDLLFKKLEQNLTLTTADKKLIAENVHEKILKPKELLIHKGEIAHTVGFIVKGVFRHFYYDEDDNEVTLHFMKENDFMTNPSSFMKERPSTGALQSETLSQVLVIDREAWNLFCEKIPNWSKAMSSFTNDALVGLIDFLKIIIHKDAKSAYKSLLLQYPSIAYRVPLSHISSFLGIKQSTLSRLRRHML